MSEVRDKFLEILVPKMEDLSFRYKKSKSSFTKIVDNLEYQINLRWDGRGGLVVLENIWVSIKSIPLSIAEKELLKINIESHIYQAYSRSYGQIIKIPNIYSQKALDIANTMNFKELSNLNFDEKYPAASIQYTANTIFKTIVEVVIPKMESFKTERDIYDELVSQVEKESDSVNCLCIFWIKMLSQKLNLPIPEKLVDYTGYIEEFKAGYGSLNKVDFDMLEEKMAEYQF
jgi:hypothetical protein